MEEKPGSEEDVMTENTMRPFVKWAGGKKQLLDRLREKAPRAFGTYYEPFLGGGAVFLDVRPDRAVVNDVNEQLINVYRQLKADAEAVIAAVSAYDAIPCSRELYLSVREAYNQKIAASELDAVCAAMLIWLNKHCFNGLYRVNSKGLFNVPYNEKKQGASIDAGNLRAIGGYLRKADIQILCGDFEDACEKVGAGDFVYLDSPYLPLNETSYFTDYAKDGFSMEDHRRLADLFRRLDQKGALVMLSNHDVPPVYDLYEGFAIEATDVKRSINCKAGKRTGREVIITNFET